MPYNPDAQTRDVRLKDHDYAQTGAYFVTLCTTARQSFFGTVREDTVHLSRMGELAAQIWVDLPMYFPAVALDLFVVIPNHLHGLLILRTENATATPKLGQVIRAYKGRTTHEIRTAGVSEFAWQANYHEHIVRNDTDLDRIRQYILTNPARWADDEHNTERQS